VVAEQPVGCRRGGLACRHSWAEAAMLAKGMAGVERDSSCGGHGRGRGAGPIANLVATGGAEAAARVHGAGSRSVSAAKRRV
jgi:hypothetical protein